MIELKELSKVFDTGKGSLKAVDDVSLSISSGEIFGIIGYSGAGKSTLIRLLNGLEKPTSGSVTISGQNISASKGQDLRKARQKVSMIFQHFNLLWSRTVKENIEFPLEIAGVPKSKRNARVLELVELVGLAGRENAYPSQLSGGQKQRVGIARALANDPEVLLCDEATSALDPQTTDSILELLVDINKRLGLTIVLITHEMHVIRKICHRVAVMEGGRVVELGDVLTVFQAPQQEITKRFVAQVTDTEDSNETIKHLRELYPTGELVKLIFVGDQTEQPILTKLIRKYPVDINIVHGNISHTQRGAYGTLIIQIKGTQPEIAQALAFLNEESIQTEVMA
ncbi:methionine ABC transporter ATP-binding protein [Planococcus glaciei]|uniref:Methionine ABC transporter ATP-binding protein n=1 Tax=Planococcus glaciei TaxID=459472 RepID=A0A7H8QBX1_9BACL|nr:methionine ABC transporter ATP-binding protein [Planococcus glaciei]ETP68202.1 methionine ABC transporter ATP-binding protein [Planococcus glaciei CHR43]KOF09368.1 methionine ABC transporter ATP-binding protein [Planococcus glaciei]MBX0316055.1 methionine ABC transporter ATP-binding protein [Planococcus glaciei]QKX51467.1 methionine ABC transporter ATP-binding protein [Planococcus glaciei]